MSKVQRSSSEMRLGTSVPKWEKPKSLYKDMVNDMICTFIEKIKKTTLSRTIRLNESMRIIKK